MFVSYRMFASLARAHERVHIQNIRDFPQTKLDSEMNAPFLLNEQGDPHFLFHNNYEIKSGCHRVRLRENEHSFRYRACSHCNYDNENNILNN